jgi:NAD(P)-dependent dehydrogenase (short-subunit alcohol dehydrogenase family)
VTGGAAGIGRALCERLADFRARVVVADINAAGAEEVATAIRARGGQAEAALVDVSNWTQVESLITNTVAMHGHLDFMFNNAAIAAVGEFRDGNLEDFRRIMDVNFFGVVHGTMAAYRVMLQQRTGHIVNTASVTGLFPSPIISAYSASKWAIIGFSNAVREEAATLGVRISVACPGLVKTDIGERSSYWNVRKEDYLRWLPWMRMALSPAQTANAILRGTARNQGMVIFPLMAKIAWQIHTMCPALFRPIFRRTMAGFRLLRLRQ